jgi:DNA repair protein RecN (Recombination protein N)
MLTELSIRDLALIESSELTLGAGLNVLTGETGAGKTLFVGAIELLLGRTPRGGAAKWVRKGTEEARVEGRLLLDDPVALESLGALLAEHVPALAEEWEEERSRGEAELILGRTLGNDGRTRAHVNQRPVTLKALRALAPCAFEIHGQNDHQKLLESSEQRRLLDSFGKLEASVERYRRERAVWLELIGELRHLEAERAERRDRLELVRFQRDELSAARLEPSEHGRLVEERGILRGAGELRLDLARLADDLFEADEAVASRLASAQRTLERWCELLPRLAATLEDLRAAELHVEEAASTVSSFVDGVEDDPRRLEAVEERLDELERLEHKYRRDPDGLLELLSSCEAEIEELKVAEENLGTLEERIEVARGVLEEAAGSLAGERRALGPKLSRRVMSTMKSLGLARARFTVHFAPREGEELDRFAPSGTERVEFLLAANPGEDLQPLRHVASGGEAARIMLALRSVLSAGDRGRTLIFDEIDAGVGGRLGPEVAAQLRSLAAHHQVLCVTHLPAIAAEAHLHLHTTKEVRGGRTRTRIALLSGEERVAEVADMIAGGADHETARAEARRLLEGVSGTRSGG